MEYRSAGCRNKHVASLQAAINDSIHVLGRKPKINIFSKAEMGYKPTDSEFNNFFGVGKPFPGKFLAFERVTLSVHGLLLSGREKFAWC